MKLTNAIQVLGKARAIETAKSIAKEEGIDWVIGISAVFNAVASDPKRAPGNIGGKNDNEKTLIRKWIVKYQSGFEGRASVRKSNPPGTISDPIVEEIIGARLASLTDSDLNKITYAHRLGMSAENILGLILEEYLADNLVKVGWHCAWGETVKSVDFVHEDGRLLQIKNRSNSENSSGSAIRTGTEIKKWFRIKADKIEYMWEPLNDICGTGSLSEAGFVSFMKDTIRRNPGCLAVEAKNPWK